jgi:hypothetical protein
MKEKAKRDWRERMKAVSESVVLVLIDAVNVVGSSLSDPANAPTRRSPRTSPENPLLDIMLIISCR